MTTPDRSTTNNVASPPPGREVALAVLRRKLKRRAREVRRLRRRLDRIERDGTDHQDRARTARNLGVAIAALRRAELSIANARRLTAAATPSITAIRRAVADSGHRLRTTQSLARRIPPAAGGAGNVG